MRFLWVWFVLLCVIGSSALYMTNETFLWYEGLAQSALTPPRFVFPIAWNVLFILMALAVSKIWTKVSLYPFWGLVGLLGLWSLFFFKFQLPALALADFVFILGLEALCLLRFWKASFIAGGLFLPLFVWSLFAFYLNAYIVWFN